jgi:hypothetical protein
MEWWLVTKVVGYKGGWLQRWLVTKVVGYKGGWLQRWLVTKVYYDEDIFKFKCKLLKDNMYKYMVKIMWV